MGERAFDRAKAAPPECRLPRSVTPQAVMNAVMDVGDGEEEESRAVVGKKLKWKVHTLFLQAYMINTTPKSNHSHELLLDFPDEPAGRKRRLGAPFEGIDWMKRMEGWMDDQPNRPC